MPASIARSSSLTKSELDLQMQALVKLKEAKAEEKHLRAEEAAKLAAEEVTAVELGPKAKKVKTDEAVGPEGSLVDIPCQW